MTGDTPLDLIVLVPGKDDRETIEAVVFRNESLGIRPIQLQVLVHPRRDAGCFHEAPAFLQAFLRRARHALVVFDREGCGQENRSAAAVEADLRVRLTAAGWEDRADVVVIDPELEVWLWTDSPRIEVELAWEDRDLTLRDWLRSEGLWPADAKKPSQPKETLERVLRKTRLQRSSAIYGRLARRIGLRRCEDASFKRFCGTLRSWFPLL